MAQYLLIESRDPFESNDVGYLLRLGQGAGRGRNQVTLSSPRTGCCRPRPSAHSAALSALARSGVTCSPMTSRCRSVASPSWQRASPRPPST